MFLNVSEAASLLSVSEKTIYRNIKQGNIPFYRVGEQYRFSRAELLAWATSRRLDVPHHLYHDTLHCTVPLPRLSEAVQEGGIFYRIDGLDKESVLLQLAEQARFAFPVDRDYLFRLLIAREALGTTAVGDGFAVPQLVYPTSLEISRPSVTVLFLENPVDFASLDGEPVRCLLVLFSANLRGYYHLYSLLQYALRDSGVKSTLKNQGGREALLQEISRVESSLVLPSKS